MPTAAERARAAFDELERRGVQPLDDTGWMNPEDKDAICHPFVAAILAAERDAAAQAREEAIAAIKYYLSFDSRRAVSWHEVNDCIDAVRKGGKP